MTKKRILTSAERAAQSQYAAGKMRRFRALLHEIKSVPCADCGGTFDPVCMDFDHRPDEVKLFEIGQGLKHSIEALRLEIAKCDIVCANCHRVRTHRERPKAKSRGVTRPQLPLLRLLE